MVRSRFEWNDAVGQYLPRAILIMSLTAAGETKTLGQTGSFVPEWAKDAIFYQIFPERFENGDKKNDPPNTEAWGGEPKSTNYFGGDLQGITNRLDYICSLGVNALYLNPIFWSNSNHKYTARDYLKIDPHFGDESALKLLVDSCHARGLRIILDGVFNHTGVDFFAFEDARVNGEKSKYWTWYNIKSFPVGPPRKPNYECWWNNGHLPKLMTQNSEVRDHLFEVTRHWMSFGIDGWRLDVPNEVPHAFWVEWRKTVKSINPDAYIVGEIWDDGAPWLQGDQFDAVMNYRFRTACLDFFAERKITATQFDAALARMRRDYPDEVNYVLQNLLGSHDTERILTLARGNLPSVVLATLFQMTYVGAPMVYYGDEIGMSGGKDPGCRRTMEWDVGRQNETLLQQFRSLILLRRDNAVLRRGTFETLSVDDDACVYAFARRLGSEAAIVVINNSDEAVQCKLPLMADRVSAWRQVWPNKAAAGAASGSFLSVDLQAESGAVFLCDR